MNGCRCTIAHQTKRIVLTGGPGAGKTAVLELVRKALCSHVHVLPEAAGMIFGGGFPRGATLAMRRAAQRAIFHVQRELEETTVEQNHAIVLCDRGTIDGVAYWPGPDDLLNAVGTSLDAELARYHAVIHLRTPRDSSYRRDNPLRIETVVEAGAIDDRIAIAWSRHPRVHEVLAHRDFFEKAKLAIALVSQELPECCALLGSRLQESRLQESMTRPPVTVANFREP